MTWEEKLMMLRTLTPTEVKMRKPGDWFVSAYAREVKTGGFLHGRSGNGKTPEEAVNDDWELMTNLAPHEYIVVNAGSDRCCYTWDGESFQRIDIHGWSPKK